MMSQFHGVWEFQPPKMYWRIRTSNRILMGINNIKKCTFYFLFGDAVILHLLVIDAAAASVKGPGEIFIAEFCHSSQLSTQEFPGALPGRSSSFLKPTKKWRTSGSLGAWDTLRGRVPAALILNLGFQKMAESLEFGSLATGVCTPAPAGARELIHRLSPRQYVAGVWEFETNSLVV